MRENSPSVFLEKEVERVSEKKNSAMLIDLRCIPGGEI